MGNIRQVLRSKNEFHRDGLPECAIPDQPQSQIRRLRQRQQALADRQIATGGVRHAVRHVGGRRPIDRTETLGTHQTRGPGAQLPTRQQPDQRPDHPRPPRPLAGGCSAEPGPVESAIALHSGRRTDVRCGQPRPAPPRSPRPRQGHEPAGRVRQQHAFLP
ncbi:hypothetical protein D3C86_1706620 [compost metagenome]